MWRAWQSFVTSLYEKKKNLILLGRDIKRLELLKSKIYKDGFGDVKCFQVDISNKDEVVNLFTLLEKERIKIDGLYYVAGVDIQKPFIEYTYDKIVMQARVVYEGALLFTNFALKNKANLLKILVVSSACGFCPMPYFSEYASLKGALISFYKGLKCEVDKKQVKISVVCPSSVPTRQDIREDIIKQGFTAKLLQKSPKYVVDKSLKGLNKNKTLIIPGFFNKVVYFFNKITPKCIRNKIIIKKFKNKQKDAF
ncbi:MAG: SDR family NAD(P)-dependent oxidoreductase [Clostridia bacterium]|nr:SDR family NAD(P)-dependent oxidoreductase [Clostridia bacterium]